MDKILMSDVIGLRTRYNGLIEKHVYNASSEL